MNDIANMVNLFGDDVRVVDPETFILLYTQNVAHVDYTLLSPLHFFTLFGPYIVIGVGIFAGYYLVKWLVKKKLPALKKKKMSAALTTGSLSRDSLWCGYYINFFKT